MSRFIVDKLEVRFGDVVKIREVSFSISKGQSLALIGPNGHGKTTLFRAISGLVPTTSGRITWGETLLSGKSPREVVSAGVSHVPQASPLFPFITVSEMLNLGAITKRARARRSQSMERVFSIFPKLAARRNQQCSTLSGGERQMAAVGLGLMAAPEVLILDEPTLGLAPVVRREMAEAIQQLRSLGLTLILADGDIEFLFAASDTYAVVQEGRISRLGDSSVAMSSEELAQAYFGGGA